MASKFLNNRAVKGMSRIGDILIPGNSQLPSFSKYQCLDHIDDVLAYAPSGDVSDLKMVLSIFSFLPGNTLRWVVKQMESAHKGSGAISSLFRQLNMGIRGIVFSLYYSEKPGTDFHGDNPTEMIGFTLNKIQD